MNDAHIKVRLPAELHDQALAHCSAHQLNLSAVVRKLLADWLVKQRASGARQ